MAMKAVNKSVSISITQGKESSTQVAGQAPAAAESNKTTVTRSNLGIGANARV